MYQFKSLGAQTNFLMDSFLAETDERDEYFVIQTPSRPTYFWGNYILMKQPPTLGCFKKWIDIYEKEIGKRDNLGFCSITFDYDPDKTFDTSEFNDNGFRVGVDKILVADKVIRPRKINEELIIKEYDLSNHIKEYVELHFDPDWIYGSETEQMEFITGQGKEFASLIKKNSAKRYGGFLNGKLIADLGIYWDDNVVRFNSISTHSLYRRQGACSTLVYKVSKSLLEQFPLKKLVMQADEDYHAAGIYESIGFNQTDKVICLEWRDTSKFGKED